MNTIYIYKTRQASIVFTLCFCPTNREYLKIKELEEFLNCTKEAIYRVLERTELIKTKLLKYPLIKYREQGKCIYYEHPQQPDAKVWIKCNTPEYVVGYHDVEETYYNEEDAINAFIFGTSTIVFNINHQYLIAQLEANLQTFQGLFHIPAEQTHWKPSPEKWSMVEIVNHLVDEEIEDFRFRLRSTLETPEKEWPRYDPSNFVTERNYATRDYDESVANFVRERQASIEWLNGLVEPDWKQCYVHPKAGPLSAEFLLTNWLAHDYHHIRQINALNYEYLKEQTTPTPLDYAGKW